VAGYKNATFSLNYAPSRLPYPINDRILFIDARNIFTQIDRRHREFSGEQIQNIAIISRLHKGRRDEFLALIDRYFTSGMQRLAEIKTQVEPVSEKILEAGLASFRTVAESLSCAE
jgi:hypothetical protein